MPILRHIHLSGLTPYSHASHLQQLLVSQFLAHKASPTLPVPQSTILTFTPNPIYTTGRREVTPPSAEQLRLLTSHLATKDGLQVAEFQHALRGGQITFHGPGQLVIYPILSLSHPESFPLSSSTSTAAAGTRKNKPRLTPRTYISLLESTTISTLRKYHIPSITTADPGVWLSRDTDMKIAALGVHLRRNVTSHGVGLNVCTDLKWFERIVACGLEGKGVSSMVVEKADLKRKPEDEAGLIEEVADTWVREFASGVGAGKEDIIRAEEDILRLIAVTREG